MVKLGGPGRLSKTAEGMQIATAELAEVLEPNGNFERSCAFAHELAFVDAQQFVERDDGRDSRFTDPNRADLFGLHQ